MANPANHQKIRTQYRETPTNQSPYTGTNPMLSNKHSSPEEIIFAQRIRQASWAFNLAISFLAISSGITIVGCILFVSNPSLKRAYLAAGGLTSTAVGSCCMQLYRDTNDRLDKLSKQRDNQLEQPNNDLDYLENSLPEDSKNKLTEAPNGDALTEALEKLEQNILKN
jgi:hypothetical protein